MISKKLDISHSILGVCKTSTSIIRQVECKTIASVIFQHLLMFQYYQDCNHFDKSIQSLWVPPKGNMKKKKHLKHQFLVEWDDKSGKGLLQKWELGKKTENCSSCIDAKCGKTEKDGILCIYGFVKQFMIQEFGENVQIPVEVVFYIWI